MSRRVRIISYESIVYQTDRYMIEDNDTLEVLSQDFQSREQAEEYAKNHGWEVVA